MADESLNRRIDDLFREMAVERQGAYVIDLYGKHSNPFRRILNIPEEEFEGMIETGITP